MVFSWSHYCAAAITTLAIVVGGTIGLSAAQTRRRPSETEVVRGSLLWWSTFYAKDAALPGLPAEVRQSYGEFRARRLAFRSRLRRPTDRDFPVQAAFDKKQALERTVYALFPRKGIERIAAAFAEDVSPAYEWEGFSGGPLTDLHGAERFLARSPETPIRSYAMLLIAHRSLCALDALKYEFKPDREDSDWNVAQQARLPGVYARALEEATHSEHPLVRYVARDLERRPTCLGEQ